MKLDHQVILDLIVPYREMTNKRRKEVARKFVQEIDRAELDQALRENNKQAVNCYRKAAITALHLLGADDEMCADISDQFCKTY